MKKAFTLIELLIVIGIIGILSGILIAGFGGGTESARNAQCLTNMRSLASACHSYGMAHHYYPLAGSVEIMEINKNGKTTNRSFWERPGWISWNSQGTYSTHVQSHASNLGWFTSSYSQTFDEREYCVTNGALWRFISGNKKLFQCPAHMIKYKAKPPAWSYVMNSYFGWDSSKGSSFKPNGYTGKRFGDLKQADKRLLFAEIPYMGVEGKVVDSEAPGIECDCVLQYEEDEVIGFNHASGKKAKFAHVVFADGHAEKLTWPKSGMNQSQVKELTKWLCEGTDVSFDGQNYREVK